MDGKERSMEFGLEERDKFMKMWVYFKIVNSQKLKLLFNKVNTQPLSLF